MHNGTADKHSPLQAICHLPPQTPANRRQQATFRLNRFFPGIHQQKAPGAISVLGLTDRKAGLAERGRLLVSGHSGQGHGRPKNLRLEITDHLGRLHHLRQHRPRDVENLQQFVIPFQRVNIQQQRSAGVADIGDMATAAGQSPRQE